MTEAVQIAILATIAPTITGVAVLWVSVKTSAKADVIHALTNDNLSKATNALAVANETIRGMQKTAAAIVETKKGHK